MKRLNARRSGGLRKSPAYSSKKIGRMKNSNALVVGLLLGMALAYLIMNLLRGGMPR